MDDDFTVYCQVRCHSHNLNEDAFAVLRMAECTFNVYDIKEDTFFLAVQSRGLPDVMQDGFAAFGAGSLSFFLMALNVGTGGHFEWADKASHIASYSIVNNTQEEASAVVSREIYSFPENAKKALKEEDIEIAVALLEPIAKEPDSHVRTEYLQGIYHLGFTFYNLEFQKAAFANFYRLAEYFVTKKILKKRKLSKELKEFETAFEIIDLPESLVALFRSELYPLRSSQVMHSQGPQREIEWDEALKMKIVTDAIMNRVYRRSDSNG